MHYFELENKRQSVECRRKGSPAPGTFKTAPSPGRVVITAFWDVSGVVRSEFVFPDGSVTSELCGVPLQKMKARIRTVHPDVEQVFLKDNCDCRDPPPLCHCLATCT